MPLLSIVPANSRKNRPKSHIVRWMEAFILIFQKNCITFLFFVKESEVVWSNWTIFFGLYHTQLRMGFFVAPLRMNESFYLPTNSSSHFFCFVFHFFNYTCYGVPSAFFLFLFIWHFFPPGLWFPCACRWYFFLQEGECCYPTLGKSQNSSPLSRGGVVEPWNSSWGGDLETPSIFWGTGIDPANDVMYLYRVRGDSPCPGWGKSRDPLKPKFILFLCRKNYAV